MALCRDEGDPARVPEPSCEISSRDPVRHAELDDAPCWLTDSEHIQELADLALDRKRRLAVQLIALRLGELVTELRLARSDPLLRQLVLTSRCGENPVEHSRYRRRPQDDGSSGHEARTEVSDPVYAAALSARPGRRTGPRHRQARSLHAQRPRVKALSQPRRPRLAR
jgi:hypothetical protein